jgi:hypothetical protein
MEAEPDGLWVTLKPTEAGDKVLKENPELGVSARIVEDYARSDGQHFPAAIQHVLGTLDPRIPGLGAWQAIEAASPVPDTVIDLSASTFAGEGTPAPPPPAPSQPEPAPAAQEPPGRTDDAMPELDGLTDEQKARLAKLLELPDEQLDALAAGGLVLTPDELLALTASTDGPGPGDGDGTGDEDEVASEISAMTDEEFAAMQAAFEAEQQEEPVAAGLSAEAQFSIDLAVARQEETQRELSVITARMREGDYQAEKRKLADLGVPPFITELARPALEGIGHTIDLANGKTVDMGQVMRKVLTEYAQQVKLLDLDVELGSPVDEPEDAGREQRDAGRGDLVARYKQMTGLR